MHASIWRRLASMLYDALILIAIWLLVGAIYMMIYVTLFGEPPDSSYFLQITLFPLEMLATFMFLRYFWCKKGQTLGMIAWKIYVQDTEGKAIDSITALKRWLGSMVSLLCLGCGYWWMLITKEQLCWHDKWSHTRVVHIPKPKT